MGYKETDIKGRDIRARLIDSGIGEILYKHHYKNHAKEDGPIPPLENIDFWVQLWRGGSQHTVMVMMQDTTQRILPWGHPVAFTPTKELLNDGHKEAIRKILNEAAQQLLEGIV